MCHIRNLTIVNSLLHKNASPAEISLLFSEQNAHYQSLGKCFIICNTHKTRNRQTAPPFSLWLLPNENNEMDVIQAHSSGIRNNIPCMKHSISKKESNRLKLHVLNTYRIKSELYQQMKSRKCGRCCL